LLIADLGSTAIGAAIAIVAGIVASLVQFWLHRRERAEERANERQDRAAAAVGPALALLRELDPNAVVGALAGNPRAREAMDGHWDRWAQAQDGLEVVAAGHPSEEVRRACETIIDSTMNLLNRLQFATVIQPNEPRSEAWWNEVNGFRDTARDEARNLIRTMREAGA
jgi:hypothetical protein